MMSSIYQQISRLPFTKKIVVFHLPNKYSSSILKRE
jgi:hypothetical protein